MNGVVDWSDDGLMRAAQITAQFFGMLLRQGKASSNLPGVVRDLWARAGYGMNLLTPVVQDERTIAIFENHLTHSIISAVQLGEQQAYETCMFCESPEQCKTRTFTTRPCQIERPDGDLRAWFRFVGCLEYHPDPTLETSACTCGIPLLAFPPKTGVYVNRGRVVMRSGEVFLV